MLQSITDEADTGIGQRNNVWATYRPTTLPVLGFSVGNHSSAAHLPALLSTSCPINGSVAT